MLIHTTKGNGLTRGQEEATIFINSIVFSGKVDAFSELDDFLIGKVGIYGMSPVFVLFTL